MGFTGIVGHEFVGVVEHVVLGENEEQATCDEVSRLAGKRVVGEINLGACRVSESSESPPP